MFGIKAFLAAPLALLPLIASPVQAQMIEPSDDRMVPTVAQALEIAQSYGPANVDWPTPEFPDPAIYGEARGYPYWIIFFGCDTDSLCRQIEFSQSFANYEDTLALVNLWNSENPVGTAYLTELDPENIFLNHAIMNEPAILTSTFERHFVDFVDAIGEFDAQLSAFLQGAHATAGK